MPGPVFTCENVTFNYESESTPVIQDCSFQVNEGEKVALKGESGSGKTTIFRLLLGFEQPDAGEIRYKNDILNDETVQQLRRQCAWLPQDLDLGTGIVKSLIQFPFQFNTNATFEPSDNTLRATFNSLGLDESLLDKEFSDLSTGQRQRVGIALCHLLDKPVLLLDEPTSALDAASKEKVANLLLSESSKTVISTSHDPWWLDRCDSVIDLKAKAYGNH